MNKLRIAMFTSSHPGKAGGVQEHIFYLSSELRRRGHVVDIFGPKPVNNRFTNYHILGNKFMIPMPAGNDGSIHMLREQDLPERLFSDTKYDLLHMHEPYIPFAGWSVLERARIPIVSTFHTAWDDESIFNIFNGLVPLFKEQFSLHSRGAIFVSKITFEKWGEICDDTVFKQIIPNAVDTDLFRPKSKETNTPVRLLFAARIVHRKGLLKLLEALILLKKKGVPFHLTVMGDGEDRTNSLEYIKNNNLKPYITYVGEIKGEKRAKYYSNADIFCAPYVNEAASISVLEAVSAGLPVVGFNIPIFSDFLQEYPAKDLLVKKDPKMLAHALEKLIKNPARITTIKKWCISKRIHFSWKKIADQTEIVYEHIVKSQHP